MSGLIKPDNDRRKILEFWTGRDEREMVPSPRRIINNPPPPRNAHDFLPVSSISSLPFLFCTRNRSLFLQVSCNHFPRGKGCQNVPIDAHTSPFTSVPLIGWCYIVEDLAAKKVSVKGKCCRPGRGKYWHMFYGYKYWRSLVSATERIVESGIAAPPLLSLFSFIFYEISYILEILVG